MIAWPWRSPDAAQRNPGIAWFRRPPDATSGSVRVTGCDAPLLTAEAIAELARQAGHLAQARPRREVHGHQAGDWPSAVLGRGLDFEEARPYSPGDDVRDMDWRTTARLGHPYLKTYREERQPVLHLVVDRGPAMRFGTRRRLKAAQAARLRNDGAGLTATVTGQTDRHREEHSDVAIQSGQAAAGDESRIATALRASQ